MDQLFGRSIRDLARFSTRGGSPRLYYYSHVTERNAKSSPSSPHPYLVSPFHPLPSYSAPANLIQSPAAGVQPAHPRLLMPRSRFFFFFFFFFFFLSRVSERLRIIFNYRTSLSSSRVATCNVSRREVVRSDSGNSNRKGNRRDSKGLEKLEKRRGYLTDAGACSGSRFLRRKMISLPRATSQANNLFSVYRASPLASHVIILTYYD